MYDDDKDDARYNVENDLNELCESFDAICETKTVLLANQSASDDAMNVKTQPKL